jgi:hypothetical protein
LHLVGDLFEFNVKLRCQKVKGSQTLATLPRLRWVTKGLALLLLLKEKSNEERMKKNLLSKSPSLRFFILR